MNTFVATAVVLCVMLAGGPAGCCFADSRTGHDKGEKTETRFHSCCLAKNDADALFGSTNRNSLSLPLSFCSVY